MELGKRLAIKSLGFVTVYEHSELGTAGGLLVLNTRGRPLEFHCTAPIRPNRAQEILFGPTLAPYLHGEQIAPTLLNQCKEELSAVFTDSPSMMAARSLLKLPMMLVTDGEDSLSERDLTALPQLRFSQHRQHWLAASEEHSSDHEILKLLRSNIDLVEPFERIRDAMAEAHRSARQAG